MIKKIQKEHYEWAIKNFGQILSSESLIGASEELGELSHAYLKNRQNIRLNESHEANMRDAVGDLFIYLMAFCSSKEFDLEEIIQETWDQVKQRDWKKYPNNGRTE